MSHTQHQYNPEVTTRTWNTATKDLESVEGMNTEVHMREQAIAFLQTSEYLVPGKPADLQTLAHILLQSVNVAIRAPKVIVGGIRAVTFLITDASTQQMAEEITTLVKMQLNEHIDTFNMSVNMMRDTVEHVARAAMDITDQMEDFENTFQEAVEQMKDMAQDLRITTQQMLDKPLQGQPDTHVTPAMQPTNQTSYVAATQQHIPIALAREITANKQIVIQKDMNTTDNGLDKLTEKELVTKANMALDLMVVEATDSPEGITFIAAKKLCNGNILYSLNTHEAATWFKCEGVQQAFM